MSTYAKEIVLNGYGYYFTTRLVLHAFLSFNFYGYLGQAQ